MDRINKALVFATIAHSQNNHTRKYTGDPYIIHPIEVMMTVREFGGDEDSQIAALLHDTIEDTPTTAEMISHQFGGIVTRMVVDLSDKEVGNRATRKSLARARLAACDEKVHTIKLADIFRNSVSIAKYDTNFSKMYFPEVVLLMGVLTKGNRDLFQMVWDQIPSQYKI